MGLELFPVELKSQSDCIYSAGNILVGNSIFARISQETFGTTCCVVQMTTLQNTAGFVFNTDFGRFLSLLGL